MGASGIGQTSGGALSTADSELFVRGRLTILGPDATPRASSAALACRGTGATTVQVRHGPTVGVLGHACAIR